MTGVQFAGAILIGLSLLTFAYLLGYHDGRTDDAAALAVVDVPDDETSIPLTPWEQHVADALAVGNPDAYPCGCVMCHLHESALAGTRERIEAWIAGERARRADREAVWTVADEDAFWRAVGQ